MAKVRGKSVPAQREAQVHAAKQIIRLISMGNAKNERKSYSITSREGGLDVALGGNSEFGRG